MAYWLIKSEPSVYSYAKFTKDRKTGWTGVRNFEARNNIRAMKTGDLALYYHSGDEKAVVGVARVASSPGKDPTAKLGEDWASVDMEPHVSLKQPLTLKDVKANKKLKTFPLVTRSRLSVAPVSEGHFKLVLELSGTRLP